jgi:hypothetical protein
VSGFSVAADVNVSETKGEEVVVYPVMAEPFIAPAVYGIEIAVAPIAATVPIVGAPGALEKARMGRTLLVPFLGMSRIVLFGSVLFAHAQQF